MIKENSELIGDSYSIPNKETLEFYSLLLSTALLEIRSLTRKGFFAEDVERANKIAEGLHNLPMFFTQWNKFNEEYFLEELKANAKDIYLKAKKSRKNPANI